MKIMVVVKKGKNPLGDGIRGEVNSPALYGTAGFGATEFGAGADTFGIYKIRSWNGKQVQIKTKLYFPTNPQKEAQQAWRAVFSAAVAAWQALSAASKDVYNQSAKYKNYSGYNLFLREYLLSH